MAKKHLILAALAGLGMLMTSCSQEEPLGAPDGDGTVTFSAKLPAQSFSRAEGDSYFSDGTKANQLKYAVYEANSSDVLFTSNNADDPVAIYRNDDGCYFELKLKLIKGKSYDIIFWAQNDGATCYTFDPDSKSVKVNYDNVSANDDSRDAFFYSTTYTVKEGANTDAFYLYRPFGQINIGINDLNEAKRAMNLTTSETLQTQVTVKGVHNVLNLWTGNTSVDGGKDPQDVTFALGDPATNETYPVEADGSNPYTYMAMGYVLTGEVSYLEDKGLVYQAQKETKDVEINFAKPDGSICRTVSLSAVPFQRNHRTNIYGSLLTSDVTVYLDIFPDYFKSDFNNIYSVKTWSELQAAIDGGATQIVLANDMEVPADEQIVVRNNSKLQRINLDGHTLTFKGTPGDKSIYPGLVYENVNITGVNARVCYLMGGTGTDNKRGKIINERTKRAIEALDARLYLYKLDIESNEQTGSLDPNDKDYWDGVIQCFGGNLYINDVTVTTNTTTIVYLGTDGTANASIQNSTFLMGGGHGYVFLIQNNGNLYHTDQYDSKGNVKTPVGGTISFTNCKMASNVSALTTNMSNADYNPSVTIKDCVFSRFGDYTNNPILDINGGIAGVNITGSVFYSESEKPDSRIISTTAPVISTSLFSAVPMYQGKAIEGATDVEETRNVLNLQGEEVSVTLKKQF